MNRLSAGFAKILSTLIGSNSLNSERCPSVWKELCAIMVAR